MINLINQHKKIGLVLAGGGGKGAYQIGVWKYLRECGLEKRIVAMSGTSVGALNTALFIKGDYDTAEGIWLNKVKKDKILDFDKKSWAKELLLNVPIGQILIRMLIPIRKSNQMFIPKSNSMIIQKLITILISSISSGVFSREGLIEIIDDDLHDLEDIVSKDSRPIFAACCPTFGSIPVYIEKVKPAYITKTKPEFKLQYPVEYFKLNKKSFNRIKSILCATSALPNIFKPENIDGIKYMDGGFPIIGDNVPIKPLYDYGCDAVIVINLNRKMSKKNKSDFGKMKIYEIIPTKDLGNLLDFSPSRIRCRISTGYEDAKNVLKYPIGIS